MGKYDYKVVFLGDHAVGKSAMLWMYKHGEFILDYEPTLEQSEVDDSFEVNSKKNSAIIYEIVNFQLSIDIINSSDYVVFVFDLTNRTTLDKIYYEAIPLVRYKRSLLVGNKSDILDRIDQTGFDPSLFVTKEVIDSFLTNNPDVQYMSCDSNEQEEVKKIFEKIHDDLVNRKAIEPPPNPNKSARSSESQSGSKCCNLI